MKFLIVSFALAAVASAQYQAVYQEHAVGSAKNAAIVRQEGHVGGDGTYEWQYETDNGIAASERGAPSGVGPNGEQAEQVEGSYQYTGPDGQLYAVRYTAGPQGFVAEGAHLPVAPPIPDAILRSIAYNAAHPHKEDAEYYKGEPQKPYYAQPTIKPTYAPIQYTTPKPYYQQPTVYPQPTAFPQPTGFPQPTFQPGFPQRPLAYNPQTYFAQPAAGQR